MQTASSYRRFDMRNTVFELEKHDPTFFNFGSDMFKNSGNIIDTGHEEYSLAGFAAAQAAWYWFDSFRDNYDRRDKPVSRGFMQKRDLKALNDREKLTTLLKRTAVRFGAGLAGITKTNSQWIYSHDNNGNILSHSQNLPFTLVMAIPMDIKELQKSPSVEACVENDLNYSRAALTAAMVSEFIRNMGFRAHPSINSAGLNIPLAIEAGLGLLGRNGLLITPEYGSSVKLFKVFTDMPLIPDTGSGVLHPFCARCGKCAGACESGAISTSDPVYTGHNRCNNSGTLKWYVNHEKCYSFWIDNGCECSTCIAVCPLVRNTDSLKSSAAPSGS